MILCKRYRIPSFLHFSSHFQTTAANWRENLAVEKSMVEAPAERFRVLACQVDIVVSLPKPQTLITVGQ